MAWTYDLWALRLLWPDRLMPVIHHGPWGLERRIRILFMVLWQAGSSDVPGPCPNLPALTLHPQSCEVKFKDKVSPKLCCLFMVTTYKNCFTGNKTRNKFYILLPGSQKRWSLSKFQPYFLFQLFTTGKMGVHIHLVQVTVSNSPELKSQVFKMEIQTSHGSGSLGQDSEDPPGSYIWRPWGTTTVTQLQLSWNKDLWNVPSASQL